MSLNSPSNNIDQQPSSKSKLKRAVLLAASVGALTASVIAGEGCTKRTKDSDIKADYFAQPTAKTENSVKTSPDCFAEATEHKENFKVEKCTPEGLNAEIVGPTTIKIRDKVIQIVWGKGHLTFNQPNILMVSPGIDFNIVENGNEPGIISVEQGLEHGLIPRGVSTNEEVLK